MKDRPPRPPADPPAKAGLPGLARRRSWFRTRPWMRSEHLQQWTQTLVLLIGAVWGIYTFWYKDIWVPSLQPANLTLDSTITPVAGSVARTGDRETILQVKATNSSTRPVYLLGNYWLLTGLPRITNQPPIPTTEEQLLPLANQVMQQDNLSHFESAVPIQQDPVFLAVGRLFDDDVIQPGETIRRSLLVRIPRGIQALELRALLPLLHRRPRRPDQALFNGRTLGWKLTDLFNLETQLCPPKEPTTKQGVQPGAPRPSAPPCELVYYKTIAEQIASFDSHYFLVNLREQFALPNGAGMAP